MSVTDDETRSETSAPDPTAVMVRRVIAFYIDLAVYAAALAAPLAVFAKSQPVGAVFSASQIDTLDRAGRIGESDVYVFRGDTVYTVTESELLTAGLIALGVFAFFGVIVQGLSGRTIGKFVTGIRTVRPDGRRPGLIRAFVRELAWIVDGLPLSVAVPLLGGVVALASTGRRRVGDMLARTYVVNRRYAGSEIAPPGNDPFAAAKEDGNDEFFSDLQAGEDGDGDEVANQYDDENDDDSLDGWTAGLDPDPDPEPGDSHGAAPAEEPQADDQTKSDDPSTGDDEPTPQWDPERKAYITYDPRRGAWMQHDTETGEWGPITEA